VRSPNRTKRLEAASTFSRPLHFVRAQYAGEKAFLGYEYNAITAWKLGSLEAWKLGSLEALYNFHAAYPSYFLSGGAFSTISLRRC
jgi:hypothetical protein